MTHHVARAIALNPVRRQKEFFVDSCPRGTGDYRSRSIEVAAASAVESLEARRLFAYALANTVLTPAPTDPGFFDVIMATKGDLAVIGKPSANSGDGAAFLINVKTGALLQTFVNPSTSAAGENFGFAVAFVGNSVAVSAPDEGGGTPAVYIYDNPTTTDGVADHTIAAPVAQNQFGGFGRTIAGFDSDSILIANPFANGGEGEVGMFNVSGAQEGTPFTSAYLSDQIGNVMATDGSHVVLSSFSPNGTVVQEFNPTGGSAIRELSLPSPQSPFTLALAYGAGGKVIVGDANGGDLAYVFASFATNPANNQAPLLTIQGNNGTLFGLGIAVRGNEVIVGAEGEDKAYIFDYTQTGSITVANATQTLSSPAGAGSDFGGAVAATTNGFVVAAPFANSFDGALYLYEEPAAPAVPTAALVGGDLIVTGTSAAENIIVKRVNGSLLRVFVNNVQLGGDFAVTGKVVINGGAGNDTLTSDLSNNFRTEIYGGAGNDTITGGGGDDFLFGEGDNDVITARQGNDVAVGGDGNDVMSGGQGRDILIGGDGADQVDGDQGDDILVAGFTSHDTDVAALTSIRTTWLSGSDYATRVNALRTGLLNNDTSVFDDNDADTVAGGSGQDWFLVQVDGTGTLDTVVDMKKSELASDIDP